jgi:hypothetical protein
VSISLRRLLAGLLLCSAGPTLAAPEVVFHDDVERGWRFARPAHWTADETPVEDRRLALTGTGDDAGLRCELRIQDLGPVQRVAPELWGDRAIVRRQAKSAALELVEGRVERADVLLRGAHRYHEVVLSYGTQDTRNLRVTRSTGRDRYILNATCAATTTAALPRLLFLLDGFEATFPPARRR